MKKQKLIRILTSFWSLYLFLFLISCTKTNDQNTPNTPGVDTSNNSLPKLTGKLVYHQYAEYGKASKLFLYNFATNSLSEISKNWNIYNPINAHFNYDGSAITFMGETSADSKWDIYIWQVNSTNMPLNLTKDDGCRDEDPKFSPDGLHICFKQTPNGKTGNIKIMDLDGNITNNVTSNTIESGMPYYTSDGKALIYAMGAGNSSDIYMINIDGTNNHPLFNTMNVQEYYPIVMNDSVVLYTRWVNSNLHYDQVFTGNITGAGSSRLAFNSSNADYSDAFPCNDSLLVLSCDKNGGHGAYDLYIANINTGMMWPLDSYNTGINTSLNELGACFTK
ncbi:MAG: PD40 domain-containing protein [Bacteroidetes bacterium]|nr:PD40 domain-containing protein [Bacteroidota bacterium]